MGREIERKFLVQGEGWREAVHESTKMVQGYLGESEECSIRVRIAGDRATLNLKGRTVGPSRAEFEYEIPPDDARAMLEELCGERLVEKRRHEVRHQGHTWEIDEFGGANAGLVVAEVELEEEDESYVRPDWLGEEVTDDERYYNLALAERPWKDWDSD